MAKTPKEALQTLQKQYARQNEYIKNNYDRISVTFPKGTKERILSTGAASVNGYIVSLVLESLKGVSNISEENDHDIVTDPYQTETAGTADRSIPDGDSRNR